MGRPTESPDLVSSLDGEVRPFLRDLVHGGGDIYGEVNDGPEAPRKTRQ